MGFNVRGIATSIKTNNIAVLTDLLGLETPDKVGEAYFEEATSGYIGDNEIFLTPTSSGTIITVGDEVPIEEMLVENLFKNGKALRFMVGETAMVFGFDYYENGKLRRSVINVNDENVQEEGESLEIEQTGDDLSDIIFRMIGMISGDSIDTLEPDARSECYQYMTAHNHVKPTDEEIREELQKEPKPW